MAILEGIFLFIKDHPSIILATLGLYCLLFYITLLFATGKKGKNPFYADCRQPVRPIVLDKALRDRVIKQGFSRKRLPEKIDAIVIGSGISGLTTAALLSKAGKKVLVLEQHDQAGGCCHSFVERGFEFDSGIHYIGELQHRTMTKTLFEQISDGQVQWAPLDQNFDTVAIGKPGQATDYRLLSGKDDFKNSVHKYFPDETRAIDKFFATMKEIRGLFPYFIMIKYLNKRVTSWILRLRLLSLFTSYTKYANMTTQQFLDSITTNSRLKAVLSYCFGDYGTIPSDSSIIAQAVLLNHFAYASSYPVGGASEIAMNMIPVIERGQGRVFVRADVTDILVEKGRAVGVRVSKGDEPVEIRAKIIVSAAGIPNTLKMLPEETAKSTGLGDMLSKGDIKDGVAALSLFVGLNGTTESLGLRAANLWAFTDEDLNASFNSYMDHQPDLENPSEIPLLFISFPSAKDPAWEERYPGKSVCTVVTLANWNWFKDWESEQVKHRGDDYESMKELFTKQMWSQVCKYYPQLEDKVEYIELGSPVTNNYYIRSTKGEIYGLDHNKLRFKPEIAAKLRPKIGIPGMFLTGQDILMCGFSGGMYSGLLTASSILNRNLVTDCGRLHQQIKNGEKSKVSANGIHKKKSE
ncbi:all-trans-retinol 13,14-reductase-like [Watersipora subatra]|uniref:all-trans-retinol 13,14-reductase-like n=1 Tax=Watersipora subatra TaxID=2589382 RepID=UPI00355ADAD4